MTIIWNKYTLFKHFDLLCNEQRNKRYFFLLKMKRGAKKLFDIVYKTYFLFYNNKAHLYWTQKHEVLSPNQSASPIPI